MKHKIAIGTGGSSGTIYAKALLGRLVQVQDLPKLVGIVMSDNAKFSWKSELGTTFTKIIPQPMVTIVTLCYTQAQASNQPLGTYRKR